MMRSFVFIVILSEICFSAFSVIFGSQFKERKLEFMSDNPPKNYLIVASLFLLFMAVLFSVPSLKYSRYGNLPDILIFTESFKSAAEGELFTNHPHYWQQIGSLHEQPQTGIKASMFGMHFQPFLFLLLPIYKLFPSTYTLLLLQACIVASAIVPIYWLTLATLKSEKLALISSLCFLFHPLSLGAATSFFPSYLSIGFFCWAFYFLIKGRYIPFILLLAIILSLKEIMSIPVFLAGLYCFFSRSRVLGVSICLIAILYLILCTEYIIPYFSLAARYHFANAYGEGNGSIYESIVALLLSPKKLFEAFCRREVLIYLANILIPLFFLPVLSWDFLLAIPLFCQNIFAVGIWYSLFSTGHLSAPLVPFLFLGFLQVVGRLRKYFSQKTLAFILTGSLVANLFFSISIFQNTVFFDQGLQSVAEAVKPHMKDGEPIATRGVDSLGAHFVHTHPLERFPADGNVSWNIVKYDNALCDISETTERVPHEKDMRQDDEVMAVHSVCQSLANPCYKIYYNAEYYPGKRPKNYDKVDIRIIAFKNLCL
jgi:uncharacterized membrane protein